MLTCPVIKKVSLPSAKLASHRALALASVASRSSSGPARAAAAAARRLFSTSSAASQHFKRFVSQRNWQHVLHYERSKALPSEWVIRAPRSSSQKPGLRTSLNNYLLYDPATYKLRGLEFPPAPECGIAPMKFYYQILTTPTGDTPGTTVLLHFPDKRYFLGQVSEGTQRACTERGVKLTYLTDVFLTGRTEWANTGGLIGTILTQADGLASSAQALEEAEKAQGQGQGQRAGQVADNKKHGAAYAVHGGQTVAQRGTLTIHGGRNLSHTLATARRFVFRQGMPVFMREYDSVDRSVAAAAAAAAAALGAGEPVEDPFEEPSWTDNNIKMWAIPVKPAAASPNPSTATSPRKRSLDEFQEDQPNGAKNEDKNDAKNELDRRTREQIVRQAVVSDMFNSTWRMDALVEVPLAQVNMPAAIFIRNPETKRIEKYTGPAPGSDEPLPDIKVLVRQPWPGATVEKLPPTTRSDEALSYVVRNHDIRGKFDPKKAQALKVRKGPDYAALTKGESVQSEDGVTVTPEMVLGPPRPGKGFAIIDLPAPEYVDDFVARGEWTSPAVTTGLEAFLWILGPGVGDHPKLREFVAKMPHCKHMVSSTDYCPNYLALGSVAESSIRLARIKGDSYAVPVHDNETLPQPGTSTAGKTPQDSPFEPAEPGLLINMEPNFELNRDEIMRKLNPTKTVQTMPRSVEKRLSTIRRRMNKPAFTDRLQKYRDGLPGQDVEIIALGTGSSSPSKYRNVSGTLVHVPGVGYYLLDCGENTLGQLRRVFTPEQLRDILRNLRMIWISHLHADHHLGTASMIRAWYQENYTNGVPQDDLYIEDDLEELLDPADGNNKRLFVASEEMMIGWLEEYAAIEDYGFARTIPLITNPYIDHANPSCRVQTMFAYHHCRSDGSYPGSRHDVGKPSTTHFRFNDESSSLSAKLRAATGLADLRATRVPHCRGALAVSLVFPDGFQLSYSGDCRPSKSFVEIGRGSTVLIHEATFQDDMQDSAIAKRHSTSGEALEVGRLMGARAILLTHFSQRYQKVAYVDNKAGPEAAQNQTQTQTQEPDADGDAEMEEQKADETLSFKDQLYVPPGRGERGTAPATAMFDYMRIRVGDVPVAQEYAPALEKLFDMLERAAVEEADAARRERQVAEAEAAAKKGKKGKAGKNQVEAPVEVQAVQDKKSAWSASESEDGWSTDE